MIKKLLPAALTLSILSVPVFADQKEKENVQELTKEENYALGMRSASQVFDLINQLKDMSLKANKEDILKGFKDYINEDLDYSVQDADTYLSSLQSKIDIVMINNERLYKKEQNQYLLNNLKKEGVKSTESNLQYEVITLGDGKKPSKDDTVRVHYKGFDIHGKMFETSQKMENGIEFPLENVISGWKEGLQLMPVGSKFKFTIPSNLAYGELGNNDIPPHTTLIFEIELLDIK